MIRKNLVALFAIAALASLAPPSFAETPPLALATCSAAALLETIAPPAPLFLAGTCSSVCSTPSCLGAPVGTPCVKPFSGAPGVCEFSGRVCSPGNQHCGCF